MRVGCVICGDLFVPSDEISATPCGHTFHALCLIQWIERSKSCPQCRHKATEKSLLKLYFDSGGSDTSQIDPDTLQNHIDNLKFQIRLKDQEVSKVKETNATLTKQNKGLKEECKTLEKQLRDKDTTNVALKSQLKFMDQIKTDAQKAKETAKSLRSQLTVFQNVETIMSGTNQDVDGMLSSYSGDPDSIRSLATFCSILKKELNKTVDDKKRFRDEASSLRAKVKELKHNCSGAVTQLSKIEQTNRHLQDDVLSLERENSSLKKKVDALEKAIASPSGNVKNSALHRLIAESPAPVELKQCHSSSEVKRCHSSSEDDILAITPEVVRKMARKEGETSHDTSIEFIGAKTQMVDEESPLPRIKKIILPGRQPLSVTTNISKPSGNHNHNIFTKNKPSLIKFGKNQHSSSSSQPGYDQIGYDGLGGHHKVDEFPKPLFVKKKIGMKVVTNGGSGSRVQKTMKNFFQNTFED